MNIAAFFGVFVGLAGLILLMLGGFFVAAWLDARGCPAPLAILAGACIGFALPMAIIAGVSAP